ncbi:MAG: DEAD/DEAH box helicase [Candidatus Micrarchaeia archaeon]
MLKIADIYSFFLNKFGNLYEMQKEAAKAISQKLNCLILAPTGSGKTEAAMLPILDALSRGNNEGISAIYITPLRALNRDLIKRLKEMSDYVGVSIAVRHGDTTQSERSRQSRKAPQILITTPETLQSILPTKYLGTSLQNVKYVIVDEIHELYYSKRGTQLSLALERLEEKAPGFQRIGLSATIGNPSDAIHFLCGSRDCKIVSGEPRKNMALSVELPAKAHSYEEFKEHFGLDESSAARLFAVAKHIRESDTALIFANTRQVVEAVGSRLLYLNKLEPFGGIGVHHSSLDKKERIEIEDLFKNHMLKAIIATSSLELGIDIGYIDEVVQYGSPRQAIRLVQRIGRSGHSKGHTPKGVIIAMNPVDAIESIAICRLASEGKLESFKMNELALDVLSNQISGIVLDKGVCSIEEIWKVARRSWLYRNLTIEDLKNVLDFMQKQRILGFDGKIASAGNRTRMFYYDHLSVIPDVKRFLVKNTIDNRIISTLDEEFVVNNIDEESSFITKGLPWKVVSIENDIIFVEPSSELESAVPDWSGEDIPVSREVSEEVSSMLQNSERAFDLKFVKDDETRGELKRFFEKQQEKIFKQGKIIIEQTEENSVVYLPLGTMANEAMGRMLAHFAAARLGYSVYMKASPYFIYLDASSGLDLEKYLFSIKAQNVESMLFNTILDTELFRYKFIQVAKMFGIIDREAVVSKSLARKLINIYRDSPVYKETLRELMTNYFDVDTIKELVEMIDSKKISIHLRKASSLSHFALTVLNSFYYTKELIMPSTPSSEILESFEKFMLDKEVKLLCMYCGFRFTRSLSELKDQERIKCPSCGGSIITIYSEERDKTVRKKVESKPLSQKDRAVFSDALKIAGLLEAYGGRGAIALSTYGVGARTASRILRMLRHEDKLFYIDLINAQKNFIKNRKYWSI